MKDFSLDYIEIYTPMAKALAYWHTHGLGFTMTGFKNSDKSNTGLCSYVLESNNVRLVLTSTYSTALTPENIEVSSYINQNYCGVKRIALAVPSVKNAFINAVENNAIPLKFPSITEDEFGEIEEASIKLYDCNEITFINRNEYRGFFKPGYISAKFNYKQQSFFSVVDHIASEVRINEVAYWTKYLNNAIGINLSQNFGTSVENKTGMILNVNQSIDKKLTFVIAQPETYKTKSKVQLNIDTYGSGIHHIAFETPDLKETVKELITRDIEFVGFPSSYYDLLRSNEDFKDINIDALQELGILIDKEGDTYLLQKFIKPISERPFFLYEIVERINGYNGFALKNINVLKKAEELEISRLT